MAEFLDESRTGGKPTEFRSRPGRGRALTEQQDFGEIVAEPGASFLI